MSGKPLIFVLNNDTQMRELLPDLLNGAGYDVMESFGAQNALRQASGQNPDVILLNLVLSEASSFDIVEHLKADPKTSEIPVIVLSANVNAKDKAGVLGKGAADFIDIPFENTELLARIKTHIRLKQQEDSLKAYSHNLEKMVKERTRQLIHAQRLASLGTLAAGIAHEINNPATFITGNLQTLEQFWNKISEHLGVKMAADADPKIEYMINEFPAMIESIRIGADRITTMVSGLKAFARKDSVLKGVTDIKECIKEALKLTHNRLKHYIQVETYMSSDLPLIWANSQQLVQVFVNLLINAADAIGQQDGKITISAQPVEDGLLEIRLADTGHGMSPDVIAQIFDPFYTTKPKPQGTGLGLSITHGIIKDHLGTIDVFSRPYQETTFVITLPTQQAG